MIALSIPVIPTGVRPSAFWWSNGAEEPASSVRAKVFALILLVSLPLAVAFAQELPEGWRPPTFAEATGHWRQKSSTRYLTVKADFDGDGHDDLAEVLVDDSGKKFGLFVRLSGEHSDWQSLHQARTPLGNLGIRVVRPGKYETLCGSDPSVCDPETPKALDLTNSAIEFFSYGSASGVFYWDRMKNKFLSAPMSD
jgi:hypothetical protein